MSSKEKLIKPDKKIYQLLLDRYQLNPSETIFCDDNKDNAVAAAEVGILGVQFLGSKNFQKLMKGYGVRAYAPREEHWQEIKERRKEKKQKEDILKSEKAGKGAKEEKPDKKPHSFFQNKHIKKTNKPIKRKLHQQDIKDEESDGLRE